MARKAATGDVISNRQLNRTLLDRHMLLERQEMPALVAVEYLLCLQAQEQLPPYIALWNRLAGFDPLELSQHIVDRSVVRLTLMRGTVHMASARDALMLRPLIQPVLDRMYKGGVWARGVNADELPAIREAGRAIVEEKPRTTKQLGELLKPLFPENDGHSMAYAMHTLAPMVHVPPRGLWNGVGQTTVTTLESWLGLELEVKPPVEDVVRRYLRVFGPASVMDMQNWSGLTRLSEVFAAMRPQLRTYQDELGRELFDLAESSLSAPELPAPVRFMPIYDNVLLGHADRTRMGTKEFDKMMVAANGFYSTFTVDGFLRGRWEVKREKKKLAVMQALPFGDALTKSEAADVEAEGRRLLDVIAAGFEHRDFRLLDPVTA